MKNSLNTKKMTTYALMSAVMCILGPMSVPIDPMPISLTNLVIFLCAYVVGVSGTFWSYTIYFLLGIAGLPVFSGFTGGLGKLLGPTGGNLIGFFFTGVLSALAVKHFKGHRFIQAAGIYISGFITYAFSVLWFAFSQEVSLKEAFAVCVMPFMAIDLVKAVIASYLGPIIAAGLKTCDPKGGCR